MVNFVRAHIEKAPTTAANRTKVASLGEIFRPSKYVQISELALEAQEQGASAMAHGGAQERVYRWLLDTPEIYTEAPAGIYS